MALEQARIIIKRKGIVAAVSEVPKDTTGKVTQGRFIHGVAYRNGRLCSLCNGRSKVTNAVGNQAAFANAFVSGDGYRFQQSELAKEITCPRCLTILNDEDGRREMTRLARERRAEYRKERQKYAESDEKVFTKSIGDKLFLKYPGDNAEQEAPTPKFDLPVGRKLVITVSLV